MWGVGCEVSGIGLWMKKVEASFNNEQYEKILEYCRRHGISVYRLVKEAVWDYIEKYPISPSDKGGGRSKSGEVDELESLEELVRRVHKRVKELRTKDTR